MAGSRRWTIGQYGQVRKGVDDSSPYTSVFGRRAEGVQRLEFVKPVKLEQK
jgi:hypothetical protein